MTNRRKPADAFGTSLLDVLSNLFGGLILLMLIVAILTENDKRKLNNLSEGNVGRIYTVVDQLEPSTPKHKLHILLAKIEVIGDEPETPLRLNSDLALKSSVLLSKSKLSDNEWLVIRRGEKVGNWSISPVSNRQIDSVFVKVLVDGMPVCRVTRKYNQGASILKVSEGIEPNISVSGRLCLTTDRQ